MSVAWDQLSAEFPSQLVEELRALLSQKGPIELTPDELITEIPEVQRIQAVALLRRIVSLGALQERELAICPECGDRLAADEAKTGICRRFERRFSSEAPLEKVSVFFRDAAPSRDVRWVLALHGMNTRGAWQEEFNWLLSTAYGQSVPVAIYKYGKVRPGAFFRFRQLSLARRLAARIKRLVGETEGAGFGKRPDVIAHSLGTLLLGLALRNDRTLEVGRVVLLGSILRPDFNWRELIARDQAEAVLNHYGTRDFWASIAHYFIPDSGPSGRVGFNDRAGVINVAGKELGHNDFFRRENIRSLFRSLWQPFLTSPTNDLATLAGPSGQKRNWQQTWWILRATLPRFLLLGACGALAVLLLFSLIVGLFHTATRTISRW